MRILENNSGLFKIKGNDLQMVEFFLQDNQQVISEASSLVYMSENVHMETTTNSEGFFNMVGNMLKRKIIGESAFLTKFSGNGVVAFSVNTFGCIVPILLENETLYAQRNAFLASIGDIQLDIGLQKKIKGGLFGGENFILEKISGEGIVFIHATGHLEIKELYEEELLVSTGKAVAWSESVEFDIKLIKNIKSILFSGEGLFLTKLSGTGLVILQSIDYKSFLKQVSDNVTIKTE